MLFWLQKAFKISFRRLWIRPQMTKIQGVILVPLLWRIMYSVWNWYVTHHLILDKFNILFYCIHLRHDLKFISWPNLPKVKSKTDVFAQIRVSTIFFFFWFFSRKKQVSNKFYLLLLRHKICLWKQKVSAKAVLGFWN